MYGCVSGCMAVFGYVYGYGYVFVAIVITPFLPPGFSRVSARKTRQPEPSRSDPTRALRIKYSQEEGPRHISQGLTKFD
jgi:hypothetical protein